MRGLAKSVKLRTTENHYIQFFVLDNQFINFLKIITSLKELDKLYDSDSDFNINKIGIYGLELTIHGIYFIYFAIQKILGFDEENRFKEVVDNFIEKLILDFGKNRNISIDRILKNKQIYIDNVMKFITDNRIDLLKGY